MIDPKLYFYRLRAKINKYSLFRDFAALSREIGLRHLYLIFSFDCDTEEDLRSAGEVNQRCNDLGITPVYAVAGQLLESGDKIFRKILETGAEFINHGYLQHTCFNKDLGQYESCYFYEKLSAREIREDMIKGDKALREVLGVKPRGFRTPHFGTFQTERQRNYIYAVLKELNYEFSSSTMPYYGFRYGPVFEVKGIKEFPLSGTWSKPLNILDSWGFFSKQHNKFNNEMRYFLEVENLAKYYSQENLCGILNFYADPSHIVKNEYFNKAIKELIKICRPVTFKSFLNEFNHA